MKKFKQTTINIFIIAALSIIMVSCGVFSSKKKICIPCKSSSIKTFAIDENNNLKS
jgi:hypothetical protein